MRRRTPNRPYRNLLLAALLGQAGALALAAYLAVFQSGSVGASLILLADSLPVALLTLPLLALFVLFYGLPALWLAMRLNVAVPTVAFGISLAPGALVFLSEGSASQVGWGSLLVSAATGVAFVLLAYRESPSNKSSKPTPLRGAA